MCPAFSDDEVQAAIEALLEPERFREAERRVAAAAPQLQRLLASTLAEGGWLDTTREQHLAKIATLEDPEQRLSELRALLAEETRIGMMVGVAVGWELAYELGTSPPRGEEG
jgi:hypothetical protein